MLDHSKAHVSSLSDISDVIKVAVSLDDGHISEFYFDHTVSRTTTASIATDIIGDVPRTEYVAYMNRNTPYLLLRNPTVQKSDPTAQQQPDSTEELVDPSTIRGGRYCLEHCLAALLAGDDVCKSQPGPNNQSGTRYKPHSYDDTQVRRDVFHNEALTSNKELLDRLTKLLPSIISTEEKEFDFNREYDAAKVKSQYVESIREITPV